MRPYCQLLPLHTLAGTALLVVLAGCGGGGDNSSDGPSPTACTEGARKQFVLDVARDWYLFDDLLPAAVNVADFPDAESLLDHLTATARAQGKDRHFSYLTTPAAEDSLLGEGQFIGFGLRTRTDPVNRPMILEVFEASPASDAGIARGDEIVAVDSGSGFVPVSELLADGTTTISDVLGPAEAGLRRGLRLLRGGSTRDVSIVKRTVTIDPVSDIYGTKVLLQTGTPGVGYLNLRTYVATADAQLRDAFARFRSLGIHDFIVDLRYNGGGLVSTSQLLNDLLGGGRAPSDVQFQTVHNARQSQRNSTYYFRPAAQSVQPVRIAFLTTGGTASASEINVNSMIPWTEVAIVGANTLGKPVGQDAFDLSTCQDRLRLVTFKTVNADGNGDYYGGLAGSVPFACAADDTVAEPLGSDSEGMVAAALGWLNTGACTPMATALVREKTGTGGDSAYPMPRHPSAAQWWLPGVN
jgi:C-terminal processing protease CtpA/Prc